jgi:hypothetical protein
MNGKPKTLRCAVYTRKSTEHNLDLEFNSLHAQREACEAYIKSQMHEGWQLIPDSYDDGGISGASLARPTGEELLWSAPYAARTEIGELRSLSAAKENCPESLQRRLASLRRELLPAVPAGRSSSASYRQSNLTCWISVRGENMNDWMAPLTASII